MRGDNIQRIWNDRLSEEVDEKGDTLVVVAKDERQRDNDDGLQYNERHGDGGGGIL